MTTIKNFMTLIDSYRLARRKAKVKRNAEMVSSMTERTRHNFTGLAR